MTETRQTYDIDTDAIMFDSAEQFDVDAIAGAQTPWWNRTLCAVNDTWVRLGVLEGEYHWHQHRGEDEFFMVLEGHLEIQLEGRSVHLHPHQAFTVPASTLHKPIAHGRVSVLMIERAGVVPTGD